MIDLSKVLGPVRVAMVEAAVTANGKRIRSKKAVPCKAGCDHCCRTKFDVTLAEAMVIMKSLKESGKWDDVRDRSLKQLKHVRSVNRVPWFLLRMACPLLEEDGRCRSYGLRPVRCSTHFVTSNPSLCGPLHNGGGKYEPLVMEDVREKFRERLLSYVDPFGVLNVQLPMAAALVLAERVVAVKGVDFSKIVSLLLSEFR